MGSDKFGYQMQELAKIQKDWHAVSEHMGELTKKLGSIHKAIERAVEIDLASSPLAGIAGFGVAYDVVKDAKEIEARAKALQQLKEKLAADLAADARAVKAVIAEYEATEQKILDELKKHKHVDPPAHPRPAPPGSGSGGSGGGGRHGGGDGDGDGGTGDAGGPGGKHDGGAIKDHSRGDWSTHLINGSTSWEDWPANQHTHPHPKNGEGEGVVDSPKLDGVSDERKAIVERALERAQHKLGYSQGAETNGYRVDCSGLVSCAWGVPGPGLDTYGLMGSDVSHAIGKNDLQPGDAMIMGDHTVLFGGWTDSSHTSYIGIEDSGTHGCVSHAIPYPYFGGDGRYHPYRRNGVS